MRTLLTILITFSIAPFSKGQLQDTVSINANYDDQVWYDIANGVQAIEPKDNWDIAFEVSGVGSAIRLNSIGGAELWRYPGDTSNFATLDTNGIGNWDQLYNSDTSWTHSAFNRHQGGTDVGWGIYNPATHLVTGDSLYVIKLRNGDYQKLWIKELASGTYTFRHASLDNSVDQTHTLSKSSFQGKNFGYFDLQNQSSLDREPAASDWDLLFTQYTAFLPVPYNVSGVLQNKQVDVAEAYPVNAPSSYKDTAAHPFRSRINTIGYDWKSFTGSGYSIQDSLVYFVQKGSGDIWKMVFTDFGGSSTGNFMFSKENLDATTGIAEQEEGSFMKFYPNPADDRVNLVYEDPGKEASHLTIHGMNGKEVQRIRLTGSGLSQRHLDVSRLEQGVYIARLHSENGVGIQKLVVR